MAEDIPSESLHEYCRKLGLQHRDNNDVNVDNSNMASAISADLGEQTTGEAGEGTSDPISASHTKLQDVSKDKYDCKNCDKHFASSRQFQKHKCSTSTPEEAEPAEAESGSPKPKRKSKKRRHKAKKDGKDPVRAKRVKKGTEAAEALLSAEQPEETVAKPTNEAQVDEDTSEVHLTDHTYIRDDLEGVVVIGEIPNCIPEEGSSKAEQSPPKVPDTNEELASKDPTAEKSGGADPAPEQSGGADPAAEQSGGADPAAERSGGADPAAEQSGGADPAAEQSEGPAAEEKKEGKKRKYTFKKEEEFCPHCQKGFHSEKRLAKHVKICEKNLVCDVCGEDFNKSGQHARSKYKQHCYTHMDKKPHPCTVCSESFVIKQDLEKHKLTHPELFSPQTCMECGDVLNSVKLLKKHMWKHILPRRPTWTCEKCQYKFVQHAVYEKHILTCDRKLNCEVCGKAFTCLTKNLKTRYQEHMFTHTGEKPYKCQFCERGFRDRSTRKKHERSHTGEKPYPCTLCDRAFSQLRILRHHIRTHTGEKPFQCELCELRFAKQCNLKYHMRVHTKEKPYTCQVCNKSFTQSGTYYKHMRRQCHENNKAAGKEPAKEVPDNTESTSEVTPGTAREHEDAVSTEVIQEIPISSDEITIIVGDLGAEGTALATIDVEQITSILASCS